MTQAKQKTVSKTITQPRKRQGTIRKHEGPLKTKTTLMREMLERDGGARLDDICKTTGWQPHTVRAGLSCLRKSGHVIDRSRDDAGKSIYRIMATIEI